MKVTAQVSEGTTTGKTTTPEAWKKAAEGALLDAAKEVAETIQSKGRADIAAGGNFGSWTSSFTATADGSDGSVAIDVEMTHPFWEVFQYGATIVGKPLLYFKPTKAVGALAGKALPLLISKHSVTIPKKFHLIEIATAEAEAVPLLFKQKLGAAKASLAGG
jgi:hypothetical protein